MKIIAIDFDGTLCEIMYPFIGEPKMDIINRAIEEQKNGAKLILWTCRHDILLMDAIDWCARHGLIFDAVNENIPEVIATWGRTGRKVTADEYWDDKAVRI